MNKEAVNLLKITPELQKKCVAKFWSQNEVPIAAINYVDTDSTDLNSRILVFSTAAFYKFKIVEDEPELESNHSIITLTKIVYKEPDDLTLEFNTNILKINCPDSFSLANSILKHYAIVFFKIPNIELVVESVPENVIQYKPLTKRPANLLQIRFIVFQNHYKSTFSVSGVKFVKEWDRSPNGIITLDGQFEKMQNSLSITNAMGWDPNLHTLNLKGFMTDIAPTFVSEVVNCSIFLKELNISQYMAPCKGEYNLIGGPTCRLETITLTGNHPSVVMSFFHGLSNFDGRLNTIVINDCTLSAKDTAILLSFFTKYQCFKNLKSITLNGMSFEDVTQESFAALLSKLPSLNEFKLYSIEGDISQHVSLLIHHPSLAHLDVQKSRIISSVSTEKAGPNIDFINIKDCEIPADTFRDIATTILSEKREKPSVLGLQSFDRSHTSSEYLKPLIDINPAPNLIEFDWRQNPLDSNDVQLLIEFIKTQASLEFLNLRGCIRKHLTTSLPALADYICHSTITGIDFSADHLRGSPQYYIDFLNALLPAKQIRSLSIINMKLGDAGAQVALKLAQSLPQLEEISMDNIDISSKNVFVSVYTQLMDLSNVRSIQTPKKDFERLELQSDAATISKKVVTALKRMASPKTFMQRLANYERDGFTTKKAPVEEEAELKTEPHTIGNQLEEIQTIMETMVSTIEDGFGPDPFKLSMAVLKTIHIRDQLNRDTGNSSNNQDETTGIITLVNQEMTDENKL